MPYLNDFNENNHTDLVSVGAVHFEPMGIYSTKYENLNSAEFANKNVKIAIPNDTSNGARARELLTITGFNLEICNVIEAEAQSLPALLQDVDYAVINGNYALSSNVVDKCLVTESTESEIAKTNANVVAVKSENKNKPFVKVLMEDQIFLNIHLKICNPLVHICC